MLSRLNDFQSYGQNNSSLIKKNLHELKEWKDINEFIPRFYSNKEMKKTGVSGVFAASLELTKEGLVKVSQNKLFDKIMIKKN